MADRNARMKRTWIHFNSGPSLLTLSANAVTRVLLLTIPESDLERQLDNWTVVRVIFNLFLDGAGPSVLHTGLIVLNSEVQLSSVSPLTQPHSDWFYHEVFHANVNATTPKDLISRDVAGRRRAKGMDRGLFWLMHNPAGGSAVDFMLGGRALLLEH